MTDRSNTGIEQGRLEQGLDQVLEDQLLHSAFPSTPSLSDQFEARVMRKVDAIDQERNRHRKVARLMAVYWGVATAIVSGLLANSISAEPTGSASVVAVTLLTITGSVALAWLISRQSGISLQRLFARTLL